MKLKNKKNKNELTFCSFLAINDEAGKIPRRKIGSSFHELLKLKDLVGPTTPAKKTF